MAFLVERVQLNVLRVLVVARSFCSGPRIVAVGGPSYFCHRLCEREMQFALRRNSPLSHFPSAGNSPIGKAMGLLPYWANSNLLNAFGFAGRGGMCCLRCLPEPTVDEKPLRIMLSEYNSMYGDTLIMHGVVHMEDDIHRKQNDLVLKLYITPMEDLLVTCCDGLRGIIPFDHSYTALNDQSDSHKAAFNYRSTDTDDELTALYANYYHAIDYLSWYYNQCLPMTVRSTDLMRPEVIEQSRIHQEWESRLGIFYTATACIAADDILFGTISLMRSKEHGDFTDEEMRVLEEVNEHLCSRFRLVYPNGVNRFMMDCDTDPIVAAFSLSPREWEVACLLVKGMSRVEIADKLSISKNTLKRHIANIYHKMGVSNEMQFFAALNRVRDGGGGSSKAENNARHCCMIVWREGLRLAA